MNKKDSALGGIVVLLVIVVLVAGYLYQSNGNLKNELHSEQVERVDSLDRLQNELAALKEELTGAQGQLTASLANPKLDEVDETSKIEEKEGSSVRTSLSSLPRLKIDQDQIDLGTIRQADGVVKAHYSLTNEGGGDLKIYSTFSSCGCTTAPLKDKTLRPGQTVELITSYDPNYFKGILGLGEIEKRITIISNDPVNPFYKVYLKVNVTP
jgi:hypothetical protein